MAGLKACATSMLKAKGLRYGRGESRPEGLRYLWRRALATPVAQGFRPAGQPRYLWRRALALRIRRLLPLVGKRQRITLDADRHRAAVLEGPEQNLIGER